MFVIGTAGHVDHGKSTLVKALTGIDPDRLKEEKEREMTIDLGFAWLTLPSGREVSIVDVPGHERFVHNMLAGVGGIDLALLVVAADESVMPQTREHLAILDLLEVSRGVVAITKRDLVEPEWLEMVLEDVARLLKGTSLEGAPLVAVSAVTGEGLEELKGALDALLEGATPRPDLGRPRLPIDRAFTIAGFGTVVTGTLVDGSLHLGQEVEVLPGGLRSRIRGLQSHRRRLEVAPPGRRVAVNLAGVSPTDVERGQVLTTPGWLRPTTVVDAHLRVVREAPQAVRHNMVLTFHAGTAEVMARLRLLDRDSLGPGEEGWAQLHLSRPLPVLRGDFFVLRSTLGTLGGGRVVDPHPRRHPRFHAPTLERLSLLARGTPEEVLLKALEGAPPATPEALARRLRIPVGEALTALASLEAAGQVVVLGEGPGAFVLTARSWEQVKQRVQEALAHHHRQFPLRRGLPREELRSRLGLPPNVFPRTVDRLTAEGLVAQEGMFLRLPSHTPRPTPEQEEQARRFLQALEASPYAPPTGMSVDPELVDYLAERGEVVRVTETVVFSARAYREMVERILERLRAQGTITVAEVRDMFNTSRKYALALMEHLDQRHITRRLGDQRVLIRG